jgi:hypothetical protein
VNYQRPSYKTYFSETIYEGVDWIQLGQVMGRSPFLTDRLKPRSCFLYHCAVTLKILQSVKTSAAVFCMMSIPAAIIALNIINLVVFIPETKRFYCAVRTKYQNRSIIQVNFSVQTTKMQI